MDRKEWQQRRQTKDVLGANVLQKTIDDYEVKMCELHTKVLNLEHDKENLKEQVKELKTEVSKKDREVTRMYNYYKKEEDKAKATTKASQLIIENSKTKWYQIRVRKKILDKLVHFIRWGH